MLTQASSSRNPKTPNNDDDIESWLGESPELLRCDTNDLSPPRLKKSLDSEEWAGGESPEMVEPELEQDICLELNLEDCNCPLPKPDCKCRSCTVYYKEHRNPEAVAKIHSKALKDIREADMGDMIPEARGMNKIQKPQPKKKRGNGLKYNSPSAGNGEAIIPKGSPIKRVTKYLKGLYRGE